MALINSVMSLIPLAGFVIVSCVLVFQNLIKKFTHVFIARNPLSKQAYVTTYQMTEEKRKDGSVWWTSFPFKKLHIPAPPDEVVDVQKGGRKIAEGYLISSDEVIWIKDHGMHGAEGEKVLRAFQPFSVTQRSTLVAEYETAYAKKTKSVLSEYIVPLASVGMLGIILMLVIIYWGELAKPLDNAMAMETQMAQKNIEMAELNAKTMALMQGGTVVFSQDVRKSNDSSTISGGTTEKPPI